MNLASKRLKTEFATDQIQSSKKLYLKGQVLEAYRTIRAPFAHYPTAPEMVHKENISLFAMILVSRGQQRELDFYRTHAKEHYHKTFDPESGYALAVLDYYSLNRNLQENIKLFSRAFNSRNPHIRINSRLFLASCLNNKSDYSAVVASLKDLSYPVSYRDISNHAVLDCWKILARAYQGDSKRAISEIRNLQDYYQVLDSPYAIFSGIQTECLIHERNGSNDLLALSLERIISNKTFEKMPLYQKLVQHFQGVLDAKTPAIQMETLHLKEGWLSTGPGMKRVRLDTFQGKILKLFREKGHWEEEALIRVFNESLPLSGRCQKQLLEYHLKKLKRRLNRLGLSKNPLKKKQNSYFLEMNILVD